ncbi:MAG: SMC family ATPase [Rhizobacter sp.]|nr:SMC family ATPase [Chlorobiales bacterium]
MTPKKLRVKNFLSYAAETQELDFDLFHVACLTGENGAGKSSLIEAIAWCIWGEGRGKSAELIREGAAEARVELDFEIDENLYRIVRIAKRNKKGNAPEQLEFQVYSGERNDFIALSGTGVKETQHKITETVGITYETFISSSFILQGRANEFTIKSPKERKEILSEMLGINRYQMLSERAKQKASALEKQLSGVQGRIALLKTDVEKEEAIAREHDAEKIHEAAMGAALRTLKENLETIAAKLSQFDTLRLQKEEAERLRIRIESEMLVLSREVKEKHTERERLQQLVFRKPELEKRVADLTAAQIKLSEADENASAAQVLEHERLKGESEVDRLRRELEAKITEKKNFSERLRRELQKQKALLGEKPALLKQQVQLQESQSRLAASAGELTAVRAEKILLAGEQAGADSLIAQCKERQSEIIVKGKTIKDAAEAACPLCRQPLTETHRQEIVGEYRREYQVYQSREEDARRQIDALKISLQTLVEKEKHLEGQQQQLGLLERQQAGIAEKLEQQARYETEVQERTAELDAIETELETLVRSQQSGETVKVAAMQLTETLTKLRTLGYDAGIHQSLRAEIKSLSAAPAELMAVSNAEENMKRLSVQLQSLSEKQSAADAESKMLETRVAELAQLLLPERDIRAEESAVKARAAEAETAYREAIVRRTRLQEMLQTILRQRAEIKTLESQASGDVEKQEVFQALQEAFGIKGIQSLLIEAALPELETQANVLLQKLTRNQASLSIDTQKVQQNDKTVETLEIKISDGQGVVRDYATFSGGEKFRVDFALRIALSKLTASQGSGRGIKMLVIDEGFGTQDDEGLEAITEAIQLISDEFEKIILITHLEKLKEAFEVKISVSRDANRGSVFTIDGGR